MTNPCRQCGSQPELLTCARGYLFACPKRNRLPGRSSLHPLYGCNGNNARNYCLTEKAAARSWNRVQAGHKAITTRDDWNFADPTPCPRCGLRGGQHSEQDIADGLCLLGRGFQRIAEPPMASGRIRI